MIRLRAAALALTAALAPAVATACADREAAIAAVEARDFLTVQALHARVEIAPDCTDDFRDWLSERLAEETYRQAVTEATTLAQRQELLTQSLAYFPHWRTYEALAGISAAQGDRTGEAEHLQAAINRLNEGPEHHTASDVEIAQLFDRATVAVRLSDAVVPTARTRNGLAGGIFAENVRGFAVQEVPLPITYQFDSTAFTYEGAAYARQLLEHLLAARPPSVTLIGHTDPTGAASYNLQLSLRRAEALRAYLYQNGFTGRVSIDGRGEAELPPAPLGIAPGSAAHHRLARRVVLHRS